MYTNHEAKENHSRRGSYLLNIAYYKLWAGKHFAYYVIGHSIESYRIGSAREFLSQQAPLRDLRLIEGFPTEQLDLKFKGRMNPKRP